MVSHHSKLLLSRQAGIIAWDPENFANVEVLDTDSVPADLAVQPPSPNAVNSLPDAVLVEFITSADGRGFSLAAALRARGDVRYLIASGALIPDQVSMALQCGFDAVLITAKQIDNYGFEAWESALTPSVKLSYPATQHNHVESIWLKRNSA